jgi:hypothetical protein
MRRAGAQLLAMIGNQFGDDSAQITGAVIQARPTGFKVRLWTSDANDNAACLRIGFVGGRRGPP